jgi:hypothetical protein
MTASRSDVLDRLVALVDELISDEGSDVVYREVLDGRLAVRMLQQTREATSIWCAPGERTVTFEATVIPSPVQNAGVIFRQCLVRNAGTWLVHYAIDGDGAVVLRGRVDVEHLDALRLSYLLAEVWDQVERSFASLVDLAFPSREK